VSQGICRLLSRLYTGCPTLCQANRFQMGFDHLKQLHFFSAIHAPRPLNHTFKRLEPSPKVSQPWFVFLAIAIAAATLAKRTEAEEEEMRVLETILSPNHPTIGRTYHITGLCLANLGQYEDALKYLQKSLTVRAFSDTYPVDENEMCFEVFVEVLTLQSDVQIFEQAQQEVLSLYTEKLGENHPLIQQLKNMKYNTRFPNTS
jgi:tetratricopeptide (TPR) repeat protein